MPINSRHCPKAIAVIGNISLSALCLYIHPQSFIDSFFPPANKRRTRVKLIQLFMLCVYWSWIRVSIILRNRRCRLLVLLMPCNPYMGTIYIRESTFCVQTYSNVHDNVQSNDGTSYKSTRPF